MTSQTPSSETMATVDHITRSGRLISVPRETKGTIDALNELHDRAPINDVTTIYGAVILIETLADLTADPSALSSEVAEALDLLAQCVYRAAHPTAGQIEKAIATLRSALSRSSQETVEVPAGLVDAAIKAQGEGFAFVCLTCWKGNNSSSCPQCTPAPSATEDSATELTPEIRTAFEVACTAQNDAVVRPLHWTAEAAEWVGARKAKRDTALLALVNVCREGR